MIVLNREEEYALGPCAVALGTFDGVHMGHRALIREAGLRAAEAGGKLVVYTFDRNPLCVICPERAPKPLCTIEEKLRRIEDMGADCAIVRKFDEAFAAITAEEFLQSLVKWLAPVALCAGFNYRFGQGGRGDVALLRERAPAYGYEAVVLEPVRKNGLCVSSSLIRGLIAAGEDASEYI